MLTGLNHITLAVSDIDKSLDFYTSTLGFKGYVRWNKGAYLTLGDLWLCLSVDDPCPKLDYTHTAFSITASRFEEFSVKVRSLKVPEWKVNTSEGSSLYILDPDGHKLEIHIGDIHSRLQTMTSQPYGGLKWL